MGDSPHVTPQRAAMHEPHGSVRTIAETTQTVLTAVVLALAFRCFFVEPFIIPTGSMANMLRGAHAAECCPACGWSFDIGPLSVGDPTGRNFVVPREAICPNCQQRFALEPARITPRAGDRILVDKWTFATGLATPRAWDVIIFRDASNPEQHLIKRVVGLPGQSVEIIDGDVFIGGRVLRKPPRVQRDLWHVVFDQRYCPAPGTSAAAIERWKWNLVEPDGLTAAPASRREIELAAEPGGSLAAVLSPDRHTDYFRDLSGYNRRSSDALVRDLRVRAAVRFMRDEGSMRWTIDRGDRRLTLDVSSRGEVTAVLADPVQEMWRFEGRSDVRLGAATLIELAYVDHQAAVRVGELRGDSGDSAAIDLAALRADGRGVWQPGVFILAQSSHVHVSGLCVERDVYYTISAHTRRARPGEPFELRADEYFVLGDNSADSFDGREWTSDGVGELRATRAGTVRTGQIVGRAAFVYLPGLLPFVEGGAGVIPDLGRVRFVP